METKKTEKVGFLQEAPGVDSSTRMESFILLLFFMVFNGFWVYGKNEISENFLLLDLLMLVAIFAPKYLHKIAEMKINDLNNTNK